MKQSKNRLKRNKQHILSKKTTSSDPKICIAEVSEEEKRRGGQRGGKKYLKT